jgi:hypothetical protein
MLASGNWAYVPCSGKAKRTVGMAPTVSDPNTDFKALFLQLL